MRFSILLFFVVSCSTDPGVRPSGQSRLAYDQLTDENLRAVALKRKERDLTCVDVTLVGLNSDKRLKLAQNWNACWVDSESRRHSFYKKRSEDQSLDGVFTYVPYGFYEKSSNTISYCALNVSPDQVRGVILETRLRPKTTIETLDFTW